MGISLSCPFAAYNDIENAFDSVIVNSVGIADNGSKTQLERSITFKNTHSEPTIMQPKPSQRTMQMTKEGSFNVKTAETKTRFSAEALSSKENDAMTTPSGVVCKKMDSQFPKPERQLPVLDISNPKHEAAIKLQKVYKSFRTRRKLADCAVLIEQSWCVSFTIS